MTRRGYALAVVALLVGAYAGYLVGRWSLEREWSQPEQLLRSASRGPNADPAPPDGARGLRAMPYARARAAMARFVARDPVVVTVGSLGRDDDSMELHLTAQNRGACRVVAFSGVAYGFDAWGRPSRMNRGGEHYVAFASTEAMEPGGTAQAAMPLRHPDDASLVLAQVDRVECGDGTRWARR